MSKQTSDYKSRARKRAQEMGSSIWYKLKEGTNTFRLLPTPGDDPWLEYALHRDVGPKKQAVRCGKDPVTDKGECWLCDVKIPALQAKGQKKSAAAMAAK